MISLIDNGGAQTMNDPSGVYYVYYSSKTLLLGPKYGAFAKSTRIYTQNEFEM